jgi:hypothetical protein
MHPTPSVAQNYEKRLTRIPTLKFVIIGRTKRSVQEDASFMTYVPHTETRGVVERLLKSRRRCMARGKPFTAHEEGCCANLRMTLSMIERIQMRPSWSLPKTYAMRSSRTTRRTHTAHAVKYSTPKDLLTPPRGQRDKTGVPRPRYAGQRTRQLTISAFKSLSLASMWEIGEETNGRRIPIQNQTEKKDALHRDRFRRRRSGVSRVVMTQYFQWYRCQARANEGGDSLWVVAWAPFQTRRTVSRCSEGSFAFSLGNSSMHLVVDTSPTRWRFWVWLRSIHSSEVEDFRLVLIEILPLRCATSTLDLVKSRETPS